MESPKQQNSSPLAIAIAGTPTEPGCSSELSTPSYSPSRTQTAPLYDEEGYIGWGGPSSPSPLDLLTAATGRRTNTATEIRGAARSCGEDSTSYRCLLYSPRPDGVARSCLRNPVYGPSSPSAQAQDAEDDQATCCNTRLISLASPRCYVPMSSSSSCHTDDDAEWTEADESKLTELASREDWAAWAAGAGRYLLPSSPCFDWHDEAAAAAHLTPLTTELPLEYHTLMVEAEMADLEAFDLIHWTAEELEAAVLCRMFGSITWVEEHEVALPLHPTAVAIASLPAATDATAASSPFDWQDEAAADAHLLLPLQELSPEYTALMEADMADLEAVGFTNWDPVELAFETACRRFTSLLASPASCCGSPGSSSGADSEVSTPNTSGRWSLESPIGWAEVSAGEGCDDNGSAARSTMAMPVKFSGFGEEEGCC